MRALSLPFFLLAVVYGILNPFRRKAPTRGLAGLANLGILLLVLATVSGYVTQAIGLRDAVLEILRGLKASSATSCAACSSTTIEVWQTR